MWQFLTGAGVFAAGVMFGAAIAQVSKPKAEVTKFGDAGGS